MFFDCAAALYKPDADAVGGSNIISPQLMTFRHDSKNVFLTYPNCGPLSKERLRDFLTLELGARWFFIALELHADGRPHLHAFARWHGRFASRDARVFDCDGQHPNISVPRSTADVIRYCAKDGDILENCAGEPFAKDNKRTCDWTTAIEEPTKRAFMARVASIDPRAYVVMHQQIEYYADKKYGDKAGEYTGRVRGNFTEPPMLTNWVENNYEVSFL